jgi:hypothetical protein
MSVVNVGATRMGASVTAVIIVTAMVAAEQRAHLVGEGFDWNALTPAPDGAGVASA